MCKVILNQSEFIFILFRPKYLQKFRFLILEYMFCVFYSYLANQDAKNVQFKKPILNDEDSAGFSLVSKFIHYLLNISIGKVTPDEHPDRKFPKQNKSFILTFPFAILSKSNWFYNGWILCCFFIGKYIRPGEKLIRRVSAKVFILYFASCIIFSIFFFFY